MATKCKRRKAVVDARMQWMLATRVVMHFFLFICGGAVFGLIVQFLSDPFASPLEHLKTFGRHSAPMLVVLLCLIPVFIRDTLTLSNRIVGPICRLRDTVKRMGEGEDVPPLKFRKNDMWEDLPGLFNTMVTRLQDQEPSTPSGDQETDNEVAQESRELVSV